MTITRREILSAAMRQSAIDCSCREEDFLRNTSVIVESGPSGKASRYLTLPHICALFSYGSNIVASCRAGLFRISRLISAASTAFTAALIRRPSIS